MANDSFKCYIITILQPKILLNKECHFVTLSFIWIEKIAQYRIYTKDLNYPCPIFSLLYVPVPFPM